MDPTNIAVIMNLDVPRNVKKLCATLGHTGYYRKFIKAYAQITVPMEKLLKKDITFCWDEECQCILDVLKENMVKGVSCTCGCLLHCIGCSDNTGQ